MPDHCPLLVSLLSRIWLPFHLLHSTLSPRARQGLGPCRGLVGVLLKEQPQELNHTVSSDTCSPQVDGLTCALRFALHTWQVPHEPWCQVSQVAPDPLQSSRDWHGSCTKEQDWVSVWASLAWDSVTPLHLLL